MEAFLAFINSLPTNWITGPALILHLLAAVVWVGGMFFAYQILRPACGDLSVPVKMRLWVASLSRFFRWVWLAVVILPATGLLMLFRTHASMAEAHWYLHSMLGLGLLMILIFVYVFIGPWRQLKLSLYHSDWPDCTTALGRIRRAVGLNLLLGLATIILAVAGRSGLLA